jgi:molecular chaperone Hsp33
MSDQLQRFIFDQTAIRGNMVQLTHTFEHALQHHEYPATIRQLLGELMAASALLAATLKIEGGALILQIQGRGMIQLLVVECSMNQDSLSLNIRATAKLSEKSLSTDLENYSLKELIGEGHFSIILDPKDGGQAYQGIVPVEGESIAEILQNYMQRSEQIETLIWLECNNHNAAGMLLQKLPETLTQDLDAWDRLSHLASTVQADELLNTQPERLLYQLFHQENVRMFEPQVIMFKCSCSIQSVGNMLKMLGHEELASILLEQTKVEVNCDFCNKKYTFDAVDVEQLFIPNVVVTENPSKH